MPAYSAYGGGRYMSRSLRDKWLPKMRHEKVKFVFCGDSANVRGEGSVRRPYLHVRGEKSKHKKEDGVWSACVWMYMCLLFLLLLLLL